MHNIDINAVDGKHWFSFIEDSSDDDDDDRDHLFDDDQNRDDYYYDDHYDVNQDDDHDHDYHEGDNRDDKDDGDALCKILIDIDAPRRTQTPMHSSLVLTEIQRGLKQMQKGFEIVKVKWDWYKFGCDTYMYVGIAKIWHPHCITCRVV